MKRYSCSVVMTKDLIGKININCQHNVIYANNEDEAKGIFIKMCFKNNPEHSLFFDPLIMEIDDTKFRNIIKKLWKKYKQNI